MSHFTVMVFGPDADSQLAPFSENDESYMEFLDKTDEIKKEYKTGKTKEFHCNSSSSWGMEITKELFDTLKKAKVGRELDYKIEKRTGMHYFTNDKCYCGYYPLEDRKRCKGDQWFQVIEITETTHPDKNICFDGAIRIRKINPPKNISYTTKYASLDDFAKNYHGYKQNENGKYGYRTNPNGKWDWNELGGRWTGFFKLKHNADGRVGEPGLMTSPAKEGYADSAMKKYIDFEFMRQEAGRKAGELYDKAMALFGHLPVNKTWDEIEKKLKKKDWGKIRDIYWKQPRCKAISESRGENDSPFGFLSNPDEFRISKEQYIQNAVDGAISTLAIIKDGKWYERGEMGWWGIVTKEKDKNKWDKELNKILDSISDDTLISIYDCHV